MKHISVYGYHRIGHINVTYFWFEHVIIYLPYRRCTTSLLVICLFYSISLPFRLKGIIDLDGIIKLMLE